MSTDKGRWFRVYARQVREHPKFRDLSGLELGAWTALRAEAELRDRATFIDRDEAVLVLRRRGIPRPGAMLNRLLGLRLFDLSEDGAVVVHDREDHDRGDQPTEQQKHRRDHRRSEPNEGCGWCLVERWDRASGPHGAWVDSPVVVDSPQIVASGLPQQAAPASSPSNSQQPQPPATALPAEEDSATIACRMLMDSGKWLTNREYVQEWEALDKRFGDWVIPEIQPAYAELFATGKVKPWDLKREVERRLAERTRAIELGQEQARAEAANREIEEGQRRIREATPEEKERADYQRRAIAIGLRLGVQVPTDPAKVREFVEEHSPRRAA